MTTRHELNIEIPKEVKLPFDSIAPYFHDVENSKYPEDYPHPYNYYEYEFVYFRKYWNIRNEVCGIGGLLDERYEGNNGNFELDKDKLKAIYNIIYSFTNKKKWNEYDECIWTYKEALPNMDQALMNIEWLIQFMDSKEYKEVDCHIFWYDSY